MTIPSAADCLARFLAAVKDGRAKDYAKARALVEAIRTADGDVVAERARKEMWAYIQSEKSVSR